MVAAKRVGLAGSPLARSTARSRSVVSALQDVGGGEGLLSVAVDELIDNPANPVRRSKESDATQQLARSLQQVGVIQPLIVVAAADFAGEFPQHADAVGSTGWVILAGHERRAAARIAGLNVVPVVVRSAARAGEVLLHENLHRDELTPIEEAQAFAREMDQQGLTQRQMGEHAGVSQGYINKRLQLLKLPGGLQERVTSGELASAPAVELVKDNDAEVLAHLAGTFDDHSGSLESKVRASRNAVLATRRVAAARELAEREGVGFLEDPMTTFEHTEWQHELRTEKEIAAARTAGDLVFGPGHGGHEDPVAYRMSAEPKRSALRVEAAEKEAAKNRKAGMKARRAFLGELVTSRPSKPDQLRVAVAATMGGLSLGGQVTHLARVLAQGAGLGPSDAAEDWAWRQSLATVEVEAARDHLAWVINLAALEDRTAASTGRNSGGGWPPIVGEYLRFLIDRGYEPLPWESPALQAADTVDSSGITGEQGGDSIGITEGEEGQS